MAPIALDNGHSVDLAAKPKVSTKVSSRETEMLVLNTIRCLAGDLTQEVREGRGCVSRRIADDLAARSTAEDTLGLSWVLLLSDSRFGGTRCDSTLPTRIGLQGIVSGSIRLRESSLITLHDQDSFYPLVTLVYSNTFTSISRATSRGVWTRSDCTTRLLRRNPWRRGIRRSSSLVWSVRLVRWVRG